MKDILQDIVSHTHNLGFLNIVKITGTDETTKIDSMADDRTVVMFGETATPQPEMIGVFGMPQLNKLKYNLECPEYKEDATIDLMTADRNGETIPIGLHFENKAGDFKNDYRFMNTEIINEKLKSVKFKGAKWDVEFEPQVASIQKLKFQASAHSEETVFQVKSEGDTLVFSFGDASTHAGSFTFESGVTGKLKQTWSWPVVQVMSILNLAGDKTVRIADVGAMQITVDSGIAEYNYILPAQSK